MEAISAAHPTLPLPSYVRVTNLVNGRSLVVRVNDRGPYHEGREIDLSMKAADLLGYKQRGTTRVRVEYVGRAPLEGSDDRQLLATLREGEAAPAPSGVRVASRSPLGGLFRNDPAPRDEAPAPGDRAEFGREDAPRFAEPRRQRSRTAEIRAEPLEVLERGEAPAERVAVPAPAYGPTRFDGTQAVATGRGLY
jgi:rare lipoprotein A